MSDLVRLVGGSDFYPYKINQSCRFNDDDSANLDYLTGGTVTDSRKWTFSTWVKRCNLSLTMSLMQQYGGANGL